MLENRDYMRSQPSFHSRWSLTMILLVVNAAFFLIQCFVYGYPPNFPANDFFALSLNGLHDGHVWQLLTFQFMHAGILHLAFNCLAIYMFGRDVEESLGGKGFVILYLTSGVMGGVVQMLCALALPAYFGHGVVGASAGATGIIAAFAILFPDRPVTMLLYFVPVTLRAKYILWLVAGFSLFGIVFLKDQVAYAAHLGGMAMGIFYVRQVIHWNWRWPGADRPTRRVPPRELVGVASSKPSAWKIRPSQPDEPLSTDEFLSKEVDPILDKISQHGIHSLTERERKILESARKKMGK